MEKEEGEEGERKSRGCEWSISTPGAQQITLQPAVAASGCSCSSWDPSYYSHRQALWTVTLRPLVLRSQRLFRSEVLRSLALWYK